MVTTEVKRIHNRITAEQKAKIIEALYKSGNNTIAASHAGVDRNCITRECKRDKKFSHDVQVARDAYADVLESIADKRIRDDTDKASAILLMFRLKALRPTMYRDNQTIHHEGNIKIISGVPRAPDKHTTGKDEIIAELQGNTPLLDEIDLQKRQYDEKMTQLKEQLAEIQADSLATIAANSLVAEKERQEIEQTMIASDKAQRDQKNSIETIIAGLSAGYVLFLTATAKAVTVVIGGAATAAIIAGKLMLDSISQSKVAIDDLLSATTTLNNNTIEYIKKLKVARQEGKLTEEEYTTRVKNAVTTANNANKEISTAFDYQIKVYNALIAGLGGLSFGIIPKILGISPKAVGGPVSANTPYLVGEKGPELFIPNQSGNIRANGAISTVININNPSVRSNQDIQDIANAVSAVLSRKTYLSRFA